MSLNVTDVTTSAESAAPPWQYTLQGTLRSGGTPPNQLTPPNLLLTDTNTSQPSLGFLCPTGASLCITAGTLSIYTTQAGSNSPSFGYVNSSSSNAVYEALAGISSGVTLFSPGGCSGFLGSCSGLIKPFPGLPNPLANLVSPGQNAAWLAPQHLPTFTAQSPGCASSSSTIAYNPGASLRHPRLRRQPCRCLLSGLGSGHLPRCHALAQWPAEQPRRRLQPGPYILDRGMIIGSGSFYSQGNNNPPPNVTAATGTMLDLEDDSIQADGSFSGASYTFSAGISGPYSGISIFQPSTNATQLNLFLNGTLTTNGLVYAPAATVTSVANFGGTAILNSLIAYNLYLALSFGSLQIGGLALPGPTISGPLTPNYLGQGATQNVVINGANFLPGATVQFGGGGNNGIVVNSVTVNTTTQITANVTVQYPAPTGAITGPTSVTVTDPAVNEPAPEQRLHCRSSADDHIGHASLRGSRRGQQVDHDRWHLLGSEHGGNQSAGRRCEGDFLKPWDPAGWYGVCHGKCDNAPHQRPFWDHPGRRYRHGRQPGLRGALRSLRVHGQSAAHDPIDCASVDGPGQIESGRQYSRA